MPRSPALLVVLKALALTSALSFLVLMMTNACSKPAQVFYPTKAAPVVPPSAPVTQVASPPPRQPAPHAAPEPAPANIDYFPATKAAPVFRPRPATPTPAQTPQQAQQAPTQAR